MPRLDSTQHLSAEEQAMNSIALQRAESREPDDMPTEWLNVGIWLAYAILALVWCRALTQGRMGTWLAAARLRLAPVLAARRRIRSLQAVRRARRAAEILSERATAPT
jgi:hypothetical protein